MKKISLNKKFFFDLIRSTIIAVIVSLVIVMIFALIVNLVDVNDKIITPVNVAIKLISIIVGCVIGIREKSKGALKGAIIGILYTLVSILVFGIISHSVKLNAMSLIDMALGIVGGAISGIIAVNVGRKRINTEA